MARVMSLPVTSDSFSSPYLNSYRVPQGVLHNPKSDRRTTQGIFHIVEGGLPVPADKIAVPKQAFAALWAAALRPPDDLLTLPFTADQEEQARCFVSLLLRPLVCPATGARSGEDHGDPLLRARQPGQQPRFRREHLRQRRRSVSARKRRRARRAALDRPHRAASSWRRTWSGFRRRSWGCRMRARRPSGSGATACAGPTKPSPTTTAAPSRSPAATSAA